MDSSTDAGPGSFAELVLECVASIPPGRVCSYGDVAARIGSRAPRAVGRALYLVGDTVPWHRVVRADGTFAPHLRREQTARLTAEGVVVRDGRIDMSHAAGVRWIDECSTPPGAAS